MRRRQTGSLQANFATETSELIHENAAHAQYGFSYRCDGGMPFYELEQKVGADPKDIAALLKLFGKSLKRIGLEAGPSVIMAVQRVASGQLSGAVSGVGM